MGKKILSGHPLRWVRGSCIGKGSFGTVCLAENVSEGRIFAVKSVNPNSALPAQLESLENEIGILQSLSSPFVVQYLGDDLTHESSNVAYRNLHMEYMPGGSVSEVAGRFGEKSPDAEEGILRSYAHCIVSALRDIHAMGIVHCDVKGKNVLVGSAIGVAKLADFGSAKRFSGEDMEGNILPRGSPLWMAPEVIRQERQGPESDVWSLGCTVIEMVTGKPAWLDCGVDTLCQIAFSEKVPEFPAQLSELGRDFLEKCLRRKPSERWTCEQLLRHPFVLVGNLTEPSPRCVLDWSISEFHDEDDGDGDGDVKEEEEETQVGVNCNSNNSNSNMGKFAISAKERIRELACGRGVIWESDGWEVVRSSSWVYNRGGAAGGSVEEGREGTSWKYWDLIRTGEKEAGTSWESGKIESEIEGTEEGTSLEHLNCVGGRGEKLSYITNYPMWCDQEAGSDWEEGLQRRGKEFYMGCKFLLLLIHLLMIFRFY